MSDEEPLPPMELAKFWAIVAVTAIAWGLMAWSIWGWFRQAAKAVVMQ